LGKYSIALGAGANNGRVYFSPNCLAKKNLSGIFSIDSGIPLRSLPRCYNQTGKDMSLAFYIRGGNKEDETWKMAKTFLLGFVIGETFLLVLFGVVL
jgi:hypothetical protein